MDIALLKQQVYEANMELFRRNMIIYTWGNVSGIDRERGIVVIKPSGVAYETMRVDQMVMLDLETGKPIGDGLRPSSDAPTHLALYRAFKNISGVTHTHSPFAAAFAQAGRELPCYGTTHADYFYGAIPCARHLTTEEIDEDYEKNTGKVIIEELTKRNINPVHVPGIICASHGPFTWGKDAAQAVYHAVVLEEVAKMAVYTRQIKPDAAPAPQNIQDKHFLRKHGPNAYYGQK